MSTGSANSSANLSVDYDSWPDGFDGKEVFQKLINRQPTAFRFDVGRLVNLVESELGSQVVDIPLVGKGSNSFGFRITLTFSSLLWDAQFEVAIYDLLKRHSGIRVPNLLMHRLPERRGVGEAAVLDGRHRQLFVFLREEGENNVWSGLDETDKTQLLIEFAEIRASLFNWEVPSEFSASWSHSREPNPLGPFNFPVSPTRDYAYALIKAKIEEIIKAEGDPIGCEEDHLFVGPQTAAAKRSILRLIPAILPPEEDDPHIYRLVLEHGDFGIHNMTIARRENGPKVTSLFDWETGHIVPALLSDTTVAVIRDLRANGHGSVQILRLCEDDTPESVQRFETWARTYGDTLFKLAPDYERAINAGRDAIYIWTTLKNWREEDPEEYFGALGRWADQRWTELQDKLGLI